MSLLSPSPDRLPLAVTTDAAGAIADDGTGHRDGGLSLDHELDPVRGVVNAALLSIPLWIGLGAVLRRLRR